MSNETSLEDQLALTLDSMMETQETLQAERAAWTQERELFRQEMERERAEFTKTRAELLQAVQGAALQSVERLVSKAAESLTAQVGEGLRAGVDSKLFQANLNLTTAANKGNQAAERLDQLAQDLKGSWRTTLERAALQAVPAVLAMLLVGGVVWLWVGWGVSQAKDERNQAVFEKEKWSAARADIVNEYQKMKKEMEAWKEAGIDRVELVPCPGGKGFCVLVDKKLGAFGENKNLYVPGSWMAPDSN